MIYASAKGRGKVSGDARTLKMSAGFLKLFNNRAQTFNVFYPMRGSAPPPGTWNLEPRRNLYAS